MSVPDHKPLAERLRPSSLSEVLGQQNLLGPNRPLRLMIDSGTLRSMILWGPPGVGKTTLAHLLAEASSLPFIALSAVSASVKEVREVIAKATERLQQTGAPTVLFLDEIHRFNKAQQDTLLPTVESGILVLIGATTENPYFSVNPPLLSRTNLFRLSPLVDEDLLVLLERALILTEHTMDSDAKGYLVELAGGDARQLLTTLDLILRLNKGNVSLDAAKTAAASYGRSYSQDDHYDVTSAFIKSIRGSDPQAALHYLARMLEGGEDPRFIARRLVILASEDIGMANPMSLLIATAAAQAVEFVGLPEARINLSHAVIHLSMAPKSNSAYAAINAAQQDVKGAGPVPAHLKDSHYQGAKSLGHGKEYLYPHDYNGYVEQQYLPNNRKGRVYYRPTSQGYEEKVRDILDNRFPTE